MDYWITISHMDDLTIPIRLCALSIYAYAHVQCTLHRKPINMPSNANEICQLPPSNHVDILETVLSIYNKKLMTNIRQKRLLSCHYIMIEVNWQSTSTLHTFAYRIAVLCQWPVHDKGQIMFDNGKWSVFISYELFLMDIELLTLESFCFSWCTQE